MLSSPTFLSFALLPLPLAHLVPCHLDHVHHILSSVVLFVPSCLDCPDLSRLTHLESFSLSPPLPELMSISPCPVPSSPAHLHSALHMTVLSYHVFSHHVLLLSIPHPPVSLCGAWVSLAISPSPTLARTNNPTRFSLTLTGPVLLCVPHQSPFLPVPYLPHPRRQPLPFSPVQSRLDWTCTTPPLSIWYRQILTCSVSFLPIPFRISPNSPAPSCPVQPKLARVFLPALSPFFASVSLRLALPGRPGLLCTILLNPAPPQPALSSLPLLHCL